MTIEPLDLSLKPNFLKTNLYDTFETLGSQKSNYNICKNTTQTLDLRGTTNAFNHINKDNFNDMTQNKDLNFGAL